MHVIAFASQKGGAGKTTLTGHLAVEAERQGHGPVAMIDTDPQESLSEWWKAREAPTPTMAQVELATVREQLDVLEEQGFKLVMIDTPPAVAASIKLVIAVADLVVVPTRPSPHDLRAIGRTLMIAEECMKPMVFVINGAANRARITAETSTELSQYGAVATTVLHQRTDFATSMIHGLTVQEVDASGRSAAEIAALWTYVHARVRRPVRAYTRAPMAETVP